MLKQVLKEHKKLVFEIECVNPECRKYNYLSQRAYFHLRKDTFKKFIIPINNKLPSEMNVIIDSLERCGISWVVRSLSQYHKPMFGSKITFTPEISSVIATRHRFPIPKGWNNVYGVDPYDLLKRGYDRVLVVQRDIKTQEWVDRIYYAQEGLSEDFIEKLIDKMKKEYKMVYKEGIDDPHYLKVRLEDLNNHTVDTFTKLMDFFNFPEYGRPPIIPIVPKDRNWEAYSSILPMNQKLTGRLEKIERLYEISKDGFLERIYEGKIYSAPHDLSNIKAGDILIIGSQFHKGNHPSENFYKAFKNLGYEPEYIYSELLQDDIPNKAKYNEFLHRKRLYPLSKVLKRLIRKPKLIIIDQLGFSWLNDVNIPVFYLHSFFKRPPIVFYPDVVFFRHEAVRIYFERLFAPYWCSKVKHFQIMPIAVDPSKFILHKKSVKGIASITGRENLFELKTRLELTAIGIIETTLHEIKEFKALGLNYIMGKEEDGGITDEEFRDLLPQLEAIWLHTPRGQYVSRRMLEAMICKTVCIIKIEDKRHEETLKEMGFIAREHYIKIDKLEEMVELHENWDITKYKQMIEDAYTLVLKYHTYECRVQEFLELYQNEMI